MLLLTGITIFALLCDNDADILQVAQKIAEQFEN